MTHTPGSRTPQGLQARLRTFAAERDWEQFHDPKNLIMALTGEVGELAELFQWLTTTQASSIMKEPVRAQQVRHELADVYAYLLRLADVLDVSLDEALDDKLTLNEQRYPIVLASGHARKYTELNTKP